MDVNLSVPQSKFFVSKAPSVAAVAGFGAGKTDVAMYRLLSTMAQHPGVNMLYLAPTYPLIKDIWYPKLETLLDSQGVKYKINRSENVINIAGLGQVFCRTMEHPHRIIGYEVLDAFLDELDVIPKEKALEVWRKAKARCRQKVSGKTNQTYVTTTPEGFRATYELFKDNPIEGSELIQMSTYSNAHNLPDGYIEELMNSYPPQLIEAYILGKFVNLTSGSVYPTFCREKNNAPGIDCISGEPLHFGMDFNVTKMSATIHVIRKALPIAVRELHSIFDTPAMIMTIKELFPDREIYVYPDASGESRSTVGASESDLKLLRDAGFYVIVDPSNPRVKDRLLSMNAMFLNMRGDRRYKVNVANCPEYVKCLEQQVYNSAGLPDKSSDKDHLPDSAGYFINKMFGINKPSAGVGRLTM